MLHIHHCTAIFIPNKCIHMIEININNNKYVIINHSYVMSLVSINFIICSMYATKCPPEENNNQYFIALYSNECEP